MLQLSIQDYDGKATLIPLTEGEFTIGRDETNSICLTERNVSRQHCKITAQNGAVFIESGATWGTKLNNLLLRERATIAPGDVIQIGDYVLELVGEAGKPVRRDTALVDESGTAPTGPPSGVDGATAIVDLKDIQGLLNASPAASTSNIPPTEQPRLVVESENLRGLEFRITKTPTVVGRVPEVADLVVDHRSISKEHARLTRRQDGSWEVLDLGSANGIQVNGEPYSKCDVHGGDKLVFGHVTMRFLSAGEKAPAAPTATQGGGNKALLLAVIGLLVLALGGGVAFFALGGEKKDDKKDDKTATTVEAKAKEAKSSESDPQAEGEPEVETVPVKARLRQVAKLRKGGLLSEALQVTAEGLKEHPGNAELSLMSARLKDEIETNKKLDNLEAKISSNPKMVCEEMSDVVAGLKDDSALLPRAEEMKATACKKQVESLVSMCASALESGKHADATNFCEMAQALDEDNAGAAKLLAKIKSASEKPTAAPAPTRERPARVRPSRATPKPRTRRRPKAAAQPPPPPPPAPKVAPAARSMTGKEAYKAGRKAALGGDKKKAVSLLKQAVSKGYQRAHGQLARLYFQLGDKGGCLKHGKRYLERYPDAGDAPQIEGMLEKCR